MLVLTVVLLPYFVRLLNSYDQFTAATYLAVWPACMLSVP
jgi:hypothetical protein